MRSISIYFNEIKKKCQIKDKGIEEFNYKLLNNWRSNYMLISQQNKG